MLLRAAGRGAGAVARPGRAMGARGGARLDDDHAVPAAVVVHQVRDRERLPRRLRQGRHADPGGDPGERVPRGGGPVPRLHRRGGHRHPGLDVARGVGGGAADRARPGADRADRLDPDRHHRVRHRQPDRGVRGVHRRLLPAHALHRGGGAVGRPAPDQDRAHLRRLARAGVGLGDLPGGAAAGVHHAAHQLLRRLDGGAGGRDGRPEERRRHDRDPRPRDVQPEPDHARHLHHRRHRLRGRCLASVRSEEDPLVEAAE